MNLNEYEKRVAEINASDLSRDEKAQALWMTADEIDRAAWTTGARQRARDLSASIRAAIPADADRMAGMDGLAARGLLRERQ